MEVPVPMLMAYPTTNYTVHLKKKEEIAYFGTNKVSRTTDYEYNPSNYQVKKITETLDSKKKITEYQYGVENASLLARNMVSVPTKETVSIDKTHVQTKTTNYASPIGAYSSSMAPSNITIQNGGNTAEVRLKYENYDKFGNPAYITKDDLTKIVYIWGYNYQYPIAEIKNITYSQLTNIISATDLDNIAKKMVPTTADMDKINNLRDNTNLKDAHITTFWYQPLVGVVQVRDPSKRDIFFEYDTFNRLKSKYTKEDGVTKKIVEGYDYYVKQ